VAVLGRVDDGSSVPQLPAEAYPGFVTCNINVTDDIMHDVSPFYKYTQWHKDEWFAQ
jgi:hypothetical protein